MFCTGGARPPVRQMIAFIEEHQGEFGVEPIRRVLPITPSSCYRHTALARDPDLASDRARQDATDLKKIKRVHDESKGRYGARKVWHRLRREARISHGALWSG